MKIAIERTDGGVSVMEILVATADVNECIANWQAVNSGQYVRHVDITNAVLPVDTTLRPAWKLVGTAIVVDTALAHNILINSQIAALKAQFTTTLQMEAQAGVATAQLMVTSLNAQITTLKGQLT